MIAVALVLLIWLWVARELLRLKPVRSRPDAMPIILGWPLALALIAAILIYELLYRSARWAVRRLTGARS